MGVVTRTIAVARPAITTTVLSGGLHGGLLGGYGGLRGGLWKREATSEADAEPEPSIGYGGLGYGGLGLGYGGYGLGYSGLRLGGIGLRGGYGLWKREADSEPEAEASIGYGGLGYGAIAAPVAIAAPAVRTIAVARPAITTTVVRGGLLGGYGGPGRLGAYGW